MSKTNLEHYQKELKEIYTFNYDNPRGVIKKIEERFGCQIKLKSGEHPTDAILDWMAQPYKKQILDDAEREYLSEAIKPFRKKVAYIRKNKSSFKDKQFISLGLYNADSMYFPYFENDAMYKGMKLGRKYTVKELGL